MRLLRLLISKGASCYEKDNEGQTALHLCTRHKSAKCMTLLLWQLSLFYLAGQCEAITSAHIKRC